MKASHVRKAASTYDAATLARAIEAVTEHEEELPDVIVGGDDMGERLTHLLLAQRIALLVEDGVEFKTAFRQVMGDVRETLTNE